MRPRGQATAARPDAAPVPWPPPADATPGDHAAAARGGAAILILQTVGRLLGLAFVVLATRALAPGELGRYSLAAALVLLATIVSDLGVTPVLTASISRHPGRAEHLLSATLLPSAGLGLAGYLAAVGFAAAVYPAPTVADVALAGLAIPGSAMGSSLLAALDGHRLLARRSGIVACQTATTALGGLALVHAGAGPRGALAALAVAPWVSFALAAAAARRHRIWPGRLRSDVAAFKQLLRQALPLAVGAGVGALILRLDVVLLSVLAGPTDVVTYDLAQRLTESLTYLSSAVCVPALVLISARLGSGRRAAAGTVYREAVRTTYLLGLPISIVLAVAAEDLATLLFGPAYGGVGTPLAVLGAGMAVLFVTQVQVVVITAGLRVALGLGLAAVHLGLVVGLDVVLIPPFGPTGAAWAMVASWAVMAVVYDRFHRRALGARTPLPPAPLLAACAVLAAWLVVAGARIGLVAVPLGAVVYAASLLLTGAVDRTDLDRLRLLRAPSAAAVGGSPPDGQDGGGLPVGGLAGAPVEQTAGDVGGHAHDPAVGGVDGREPGDGPPAAAGHHLLDGEAGLLQERPQPVAGEAEVVVGLLVVGPVQRDGDDQPPARLEHPGDVAEQRRRPASVLEHLGAQGGVGHAVGQVDALVDDGDVGR